ncbi:MAG: DUF2325 domain-containing protein [Polyangiaceae bacterium]
MTALLIGADYVEPIKEVLAEAGLETGDHWSGRKPGDLKRSIPRDTSVVVVMTDYVNHCLVKKIRQDCSKLHIPVVFCRRHVQEVREKIQPFARRKAA